MFNKILPMTGVEPQTSGIESDHSTNWATTTSLYSIYSYVQIFKQSKFEKLAFANGHWNSQQT